MMRGMDRAVEAETDRGELAAVLRAHLERKQNGSQGIVVLTRNEADVVASLLDVLTRDEYLTDLGLLAADCAAMLRQQTGF
jgi:hypothetical protein